MARGRRRKPIALKLVGETFKKSRDGLAENPELLPVTDESVPGYFDEYDVAVWNRLFPALRDNGTLKQTDMPGFEILVSMLALVDRSAVEGGVLTASYYSELRRWLSEYGLSPSTRSNVRITPKKKGGIDYSQFLSGPKDG